MQPHCGTTPPQTIIYVTSVWSTYLAKHCRLEACSGPDTAQSCPQVAPSRESFLAKLTPSPGCDIMDELGTCTSAFAPVLARVQTYLADHGLDDPTKV